MKLNSIFDCVSETCNLIDNVTNFVCHDKADRTIFEIVYFPVARHSALHKASRESCEKIS